LLQFIWLVGQIIWLKRHFIDFHSSHFLLFLLRLFHLLGNVFQNRRLLASACVDIRIQQIILIKHIH
jgi:hypothetical protein